MAKQQVDLEGCVINPLNELINNIDELLVIPLSDVTSDIKPEAKQEYLSAILQQYTSLSHIITAINTTWESAIDKTNEFKRPFLPNPPTAVAHSLLDNALLLLRDNALVINNNIQQYCYRLEDIGLQKQISQKIDNLLIRNNMLSETISQIQITLSSPSDPSSSSPTVQPEGQQSFVSRTAHRSSGSDYMGKS